ncbi:hypothetical protein F8M41_000943 [Gigaspora margarita]|uniref:Uncharacterized protein n=1 Tax=Gigaspora margarita TaxID=4874 RepID=A0A8H3XFS8_GIGMA|nr:hypothetical protein F8M41_000943 [Gigaspora margarita]
MNTTLTTLCLESNNIGVEGDLSYNRINDEGGKALAAALTINATLTLLNLSSNKISDEGGEALAAALSKNRILLSLNLYDNRISYKARTNIKNIYRIKFSKYYESIIKALS